MMSRSRVCRCIFRCNRLAVGPWGAATLWEEEQLVWPGPPGSAPRTREGGTVCSCMTASFLHGRLICHLALSDLRSCECHFPLRVSPPAVLPGLELV